MRKKCFQTDKIQQEYLPFHYEIVMAREIFGPDYLPYRQEKQM
ncbi:MAG: hypothetical protein ACFFEK_13305 [Candidatus Thorarchaeota archaeon]